ncbi:GPP34 family phosphoprotein [Streptomyces sp. NPDC056227]|uniref:GPP34 family phosphoprotein n=1 Tax=Streptomyces sp. NPDC056227 TaxID=3345753 RepID=UPI0035DDE8D2
MTTARDLALVTLGLPPDRSVEQGDLFLVLAGAEAIDLLESGALTLDGDRMVLGPRVTTGDRLLDQALASLVRREPYETVGDWLWRRGARLAAAYAEDLERAGLVIPSRGIGLRASRAEPTSTATTRRPDRTVRGREPPRCVGSGGRTGEGQGFPRPRRRRTRAQPGRRRGRSGATTGGYRPAGGPPVMPGAP